MIGHHASQIVGTVLSGAVAVAGVDTISGSTSESIIGGIGMVGGLAGVVAFLFRWGVTTTAAARAEGNAAMAQIRQENRDEVTALRVEHTAEIAALRLEHTAEIAALRVHHGVEIERLRNELNDWRKQYLTLIAPKQPTREKP